MFAVYAKDSEKLGQTFKFLSEAFALDDREGTVRLSSTFT